MLTRTGHSTSNCHHRRVIRSSSSSSRRTSTSGGATFYHSCFGFICGSFLLYRGYLGGLGLYSLRLSLNSM